MRSAEADEGHSNSEQNSRHMAEEVVAGGGTGYGWSDSGLRSLNAFLGAIDPKKIPSAELLHVRCIPSTANVGQQEMPRLLEPDLKYYLKLYISRFGGEEAFAHLKKIYILALSITLLIAHWLMQ